MKQIDFLPTRYHDQGVKRRSQIWRYLLVVLFGGVCAATAVGQHVLRRAVALQIEQVATQHISAEAADKRFHALQAELLEVQAEAELYTFLRHPWPRTQIMVAVAKHLPESVSLMQLQIQGELPAAEKRAPSRRVRTSESEEDAATNQPRAQRDFKNLNEEFGRLQTVVNIVGETTDTATLHKFVADLADNNLFAKAELVSLDALTGKTQIDSSEFSVRIVVREGYGQPNGPRREARVDPNRRRPADEGAVK